MAACGLVLAAAYLSTWPLTNTGVFDDWSFIRTALDLSRTGEFRYNGWAAPMIGAQAWIGAASARIFGPTLDAVRLSMLPLAILTSLVLRALLRHAGVRPALASLGAVAFGLSPVVIPLATSFMTDLPALLGSLLCALALVRASESSQTRQSIAWLCAAAVAGALGGSVRQTAWLAPIAMLPCFAVFERRRPPLALAAVAMAAVSVVLAVQSGRWLAAQPYVAEVRNLGDNVAPMLAGLPTSLRKVPPLLYTALALLLPLSCARIANAAWNGGRAMQTRLAVAWIVALGTAWMLYSVAGAAPWLANLLCRTGLVGAGETVLGQSPLTMTPAVQKAIALGSYASIPLLIATMTMPRRRDAVMDRERFVVALLVGFAIAYSAVLALYTFRANSFDRYVVPILPCAIVLLLRRWPASAKSVWPANIAALLIACWGLYGIAITHDMFSTLRARREAFDMLVEHGAAPTSISGGFEIDGLTQLDAAGFVANPAVKNPLGIRMSYRRRNDLRLPFWFLNHTPSIKPRWWITLSPVPGFREADLPQIEYSTWLPPGRRQIHVVETP